MRKTPALLNLWLGLISAMTVVAAERPNVVFIVSEDNSIHYLRHFFEGGAETPAIESMAKNGLTFDHAFSCSPVCSVARTTLATSCYGPRVGTQFHRKYATANLPGDLKFFHAYLKEAGYYTTNRSKEDYNANRKGEVWDKSSKDASWRHRAEGQPFFHMESHGNSHESSLHFNQASYENDKTTHDPAAVKLADYFPDTPLFRYTHARYLDNIQTIDRLVAKTLKGLEDEGVLEDTFVFYFGDHGGVLPRGKGYAYQSGLHVPLVVRVPENFKHLVDGERGGRVSGFVSFVDFGPTALNLAGLSVPGGVDGKPFLGQGVTMAEVNTRDEAFGYADRFDEKYEFVRTLRKGNFHYIRCFQGWLPDGLRNNYRYRMLAYNEWRDLYNAGKLNRAQSQFYEEKPVEMLFDLGTDPHEVHNLAGDPAHAETLAKLRGNLGERLRSLPDLSFYPESYLTSEVLPDAADFGQVHKGDIARYADLADLALGDCSNAQLDLEAAIKSTDPMERYWAAMVCSSFGDEASELASKVEPLLQDEVEVVRIRAAEFLGRIGKLDPVSVLTDVVNTTENAVTAAEALNSLVYFADHHKPSITIDKTSFRPIAKGDGIARRLEYLTGVVQEKRTKKKKKK